MVMLVAAKAEKAEVRNMKTAASSTAALRAPRLNVRLRDSPRRNVDDIDGSIVLPWMCAGPHYVHIYESV
jgi:hypothetical protein